MSEIKAFRVGDSDVYAAYDAFGALKAANDMTGEGEFNIDEVMELTDYELDVQYPEFDEDERPTGSMTTIRIWLSETVTPGWLCGSGW